MSRTTPFILACFVFLMPVVRAGVLRTKDGQVFEGNLRFGADGSVKVTPAIADGFPLSFPLANIDKLTFRQSIGGVLSGGVLAGDWGVQDIGAMGILGSADYAAGEFTLRGEGAPMGNAGEMFHYVYHHLPADGQLIAHVQSLAPIDSESAPLDPLAKAGLMIRQGLEPGERFCAIALTADEGIRFYHRKNLDSAATTDTAPAGPKIKPPYWIKLAKINQRVVAARSVDGRKWEFVGELPMETLRDAYIGMFVSSHRADQLATSVFDHVRVIIHGLQGEYFGEPRFKDLRTMRIDPNIDFNWAGGSPDPAIPANNISIRWTGQLLAPTSDAYHFSLSADTAAKLLINGKVIVDTASRVPRSGTINLVMDKRYDIEVDFYEGGGNASCKLLWSSSTQPQIVIPPDQFYYTPPAGVVNPPADPAMQAKTPNVPHGLLLADGSFLPGSVKVADANTLTFAYRDSRELSVPTHQIACVILHPLNTAKIATKGAGVLTLAGDFIEGDCQEISAGKTKLNSVVFGVSSYNNSTQTAAIVYRNANRSNARWLIHTTTGGIIYANSIRVDQQKLLVDEPLIGPFEIRVGEINDIAAN